jgi:hypothetical protein
MKIAPHQQRSTSPQAFRPCKQGPVPVCPTVLSQEQSDTHERSQAVRQGQRALTSFYASFLRTVCTGKKTLVLLPKGTFYLGTPKHYSVLKVQAAQQAMREASRSIAQRRLVVNRRTDGASSPGVKAPAFTLALGNNQLR